MMPGGIPFSNSIMPVEKMEANMATRSTLNEVRFVQPATGRATRPTLMRQAWTALVQMARTRQTRRLLAEMDDRMLADIGIGRGDAMMEASRAPWDLGTRR